MKNYIIYRYNSIKDILNNKIITLIFLIFIIINSIPIMNIFNEKYSWYIKIILSSALTIGTTIFIVFVIISLNYLVIKKVYLINKEFKGIIDNSFGDFDIDYDAKSIIKKIQINQIPDHIILNYWIYYLKRNQFRIVIMIPAVIILFNKIYTYLVNQYLIHTNLYNKMILLLRQDNIGLFFNIYIWFFIIVIYYMELRNINNLINKINFLLNINPK